MIIKYLLVSGSSTGSSSSSSSSSSSTNSTEKSTEFMFFDCQKKLTFARYVTMASNVKFRAGICLYL